MTTPSGIRPELDRLAAAVDTYAAIHRANAEHRGADDLAESWYWTSTTAYSIRRTSTRSSNT